MRTSILLASLLFAACGEGSGTAPVVPLPPPSGNLSIGDVQGNGPSSPYDGQVVSISGIVTGDFQENDAHDTNNLGGFYLQQEFPDNNPATSDGIFIFDGNNPAIDVDAGDRVDVRGTVNEYFGETQISSPTVAITGSGTIQPLTVTLPMARTVTSSDGKLLSDMEHLEGMLLKLPQTLSVTNLRNLERFGSVGLSEGGRRTQFTNSEAPSATGYNEHKQEAARRSIELDDGKRSSNPATVRFLAAGSAPGYSIRTGDAVTGVTGNLRFSRGSGGDGDEAWRIMPTIDPEFESLNPRPGAPTIAGTVRVASFNVLNLFSTIDRGQSVCGPRGNDGCRGADSDQELARQLAKTTSALQLLNADVVGLIELENNASESLQMIVGGLNARIGTSEYALLDTGTIHDDVIKTGFIYKTSTIEPAGMFALLDRSVDSRFNDARNRPALAQTFRATSNDAKVTIVVNHLKSKGSSCDADGDPNTGDGQGNCNQTRSNAAAAIADWIATDPTGSNDPDFLIIGDMNAYTREDPLTAFKNAGLTNLIEANSNAYSFVFDAEAGALDHAIASASLVPQAVATMEWHINADEPALLDYNLENGRAPALFDADSPYRASDHDPVIIGLDLTN